MTLKLGDGNNKIVHVENMFTVDSLTNKNTRKSTRT